jgi:hypothetical protein
MVKSALQPLSAEALVKAIENNQSRVMFLLPNDQIEQTLLNADLFGFARALKKHPPIYATDLTEDEKHSE